MSHVLMFFHGRKQEIQKQARIIVDDDRTENDDPVDSDPLFELRITEDKGAGLFAVKKIVTGTCVLTDKPLLSIPASDDGNEEVFQQAFAALSDDDRKTYLKLYDAKKSRQSKVMSIYYSNCYKKSVAGVEVSKDSCIGALASRINHSCVPNLQVNYHPEQDVMVFHAIKTIPRGKELLSNYSNGLDITRLRNPRQRELLLHYGFTCRCEACEPQTDFWEKSDDRRRQMARIKQQMLEYAKSKNEKVEAKDVKAMRDAASRLAELLEKEGLVGAPLADLYKKVARWAEKHEQWAEARTWRERELNTCRTCYGETSERVKGTLEHLTTVQSKQTGAAGTVSS